MRPLFLAVLLSLFLAPTLFAGVYVVTSDADAGPGSLRQGILDANSGACSSPCLINYGSYEGTLRIAPLTPLPAITAAQTSITPHPAYRGWTLEINGRNLTSGNGLTLRGANCNVTGLIINGFPGSGISVEDAVGARVSANVIGLNADGTEMVPNGGNGITVLRALHAELETNTIGGNAGHGIHVSHSQQLFVSFQYIGKQYLPQGSGDAIFPNGGHGVLLHNVAGATFYINEIANNGGAGIAVTGDSTDITMQNRQLPTKIYNNALLPIDLGLDGPTPNAPGRVLNAPVITTAEVNNGFVRVVGSVSTAPNTDVEINLFASDSVKDGGTGDAQLPVHAEVRRSDANGNVNFEMRFSRLYDVTGKWISATQTTMHNGTSEVSMAMHAMSNDQKFVVLNTNDSGAGSLRQAILDANSGPCAADYPCTIEFSLPLPIPERGYHTIQPLTPLPAITRSGIRLIGAPARPIFDSSMVPLTVEINGSRSTPGPGLTIKTVGTDAVVNVVIRGLAINGFSGDGILLDATGAVQGSHSPFLLSPRLEDNFIGTDPNGLTAVPNLGAGIRVRGEVVFVHNGTYGSGNRMVRNLISGNGSHGVALEGGFFELEYNKIGTDITGTQPLPNGGSGLYVERGARSHEERNTIAFNRKAGVSIIDPAPGTFNGAIVNSIHSNAGLEVDLRDDGPSIAAENVQNPPDITTVTYDPATGVGTITGTYTRVNAFPNSYSPGPWLDFAVSRFPEADGRGSAETPVFVNMNSVIDKGNGLFTFVAKSQSADLRGKRISATATPYAFTGLIFGQGFLYGTTSEMSEAVPVVTIGCPADRPELVGPEGELPKHEPNVLRWTAATGATSYDVWIRRAPGLPRVIATTSGVEVAVPLGAGSYEWFVEAHFGGDCPSVMSEAFAIEAHGRRRRAVSPR